MHFLQSFKLSITLVLLSFITACAVPKHIAQPDSTDTFQRVGRFSVNSTEIDGTQNAVQGGFAWLDSNDKLSLDLSNPVGSTLARVVVSNQGASLQQSDGSMVYADNVDDLIKQAIGSDIPVSCLRNWLSGKAGSTAVINQYDENKNIAKLNENGWQVELSRYDDLGPTLLRLNHSAAGTKINVRLAIR